jgi:ABC-type polysaccharide/polyol phosphate export permease
MAVRETLALPETVIQAEDPPQGLVGGLRELAAHRELLINLTLREIRVRYKQSVLGVGWAVVQPLVMMFIFTIVFSRFARLPSEGLPYPVFSYAALLPWTFFSSAVSNAIQSVVTGGSLIKKVYFPRAVLPLAAILTHGLDFLISAGVFGLLMLYYGVSLSIHALYVLPLLVLQLALMGGVSMLLAAFNAYYRDVRYILPVAMQVWLYATPVVWSMTMVPEQYRIPYAILNPMAAVIDGFRAALLRGTPPAWDLVGAAAVSSILLLAVAYRYFTHVQRNFADII